MIMAQLTDDCFAFGNRLMTTHEALDQINNQTKIIVDVEDLALEKTIGRILAKDVVSSRAVPGHDNSAVDGFAVCFDDLSKNKDTRLPISGRIIAGHPLKKETVSGTAYRIFTGAPMPKGTDTVLMQEDCQKEGSIVTIPSGIKKGANRRFSGEDIKKGSVVLKSGKRLKAQDIGLAASIGCSTLCLYKPLRVALFSTGDEICNLGETLSTSCIYDANRYSIGALLHQLGCNINDLGILTDKLDVIKDSLNVAAKKNDVIITTAGVSTGEEDHIRQAVSALGQIHFWRLAIRPGRPIALGQIGKKPFIGLPGNPVAAMITFMRFARPALLLMNGAKNVEPRFFKVTANFDYLKKTGRREWVRALLETDKKGELQAKKFPKSGAGILSSMVAADGLVELSEEIMHVKKGDMVDFLPFSEVI